MLLSIKNENLVLTVSLLGAEKVSLKTKDGKEYLHQSDQYWQSTAPFLFPNVGRLKNGYTYIENLKYELPLHGILRFQTFEVMQHKEDEITLLSIFNKETLKKYPFEYKVFVTYQLKDFSLKTQVRITNHSTKVMPFNFGAHPGINIPLYPNEEFSDYRIIFNKREKFCSPAVEKDGTINYDKSSFCFNNITELPLKYEYFANDAIIIPRVRSNEVKLVNKHLQGISFSFSNFISLAFWTRPQAKYLCLEPWIGHGDRYDTNHIFIEKDNIINLDATKDFFVSYTITILK